MPSSPSAEERPDNRLHPGDALGGALLAFAAALHLAAAFRMRVDNDEPQHLHVVWGWTRGLLPYRDLFDNHMPLFHLLLTPALRLVGERPDALLWMRLTMLPLLAASLTATWLLAERLFSRRVALWSVVLTAVVPPYFLASTEFRTDNLWAAMWLAALAAAAWGRPSARRALLAGTFAGLAAATSLKTSLLLFSLAVGATIALLGSDRESRRGRAVDAGRFAAIAALPLVGIPAAFAAAFAAAGLWRPFYSDVFAHNLLWSPRPRAIVAWLASLALTAVAVTLWQRRSAHPLAFRRALLLSTALVYAASLKCLWTFAERQSWLPVIPLLALFLAAAIDRLAGRRAAALQPALATALFLTVLLHSASPWRDSTRQAVGTIREILAISDPGDAVVDLKGEMIFRPRAGYYVMERITREKIREGLLPDTLPSDAVRSGAMIAACDDPRFPPATRRFLDQSFLQLGDLRVAGGFVPSSGTFLVRIPSLYALVSRDGAFAGSVDGRRYTAPRWLSAGLHVASPVSRPTAFVWWKAVARGFSPFTHAVRSLSSTVVAPPPRHS